MAEIGRPTIGRATSVFVAVATLIAAAASLSSLHHGIGLPPPIDEDEEEQRVILGVGGGNNRGTTGSTRNLRRDRQNSDINKKQKKKKLLIKYKAGASGESLIRSWRRNKRASSSRVPVRDFKRGNVALIEIDEEDEKDLLYELEDDDDVEFVEEDFVVYKDPLPDGRKEQRRIRVVGQHPQRSLAEEVTYGAALVGAPTVWQRVASEPDKYRSQPIKVCIVDTGYDLSHPDLPKLDHNLTFTDPESTGYGNPLEDGDGHGTHCAGTIGALGGNGKGIMGINPDPTKFSFHVSKALSDEGLGTASSVLAGIEGCLDAGAKVISMSIGGGPESKIFKSLYENAYNAGVLFFAASGNLGLLQDDYPASYSTVVSVGAVNDEGKRADYSNKSNQLEILGPGSSIKSTYPGGYGILSGTSMAVPYLAGVATLIWSYFPACSNDQIRNVLLLSAKRMAPIGCNRQVGFGLVQANAAFSLLDEYGCKAGGESMIPKSRGAVGGCKQPLPDLSLMQASAKIDLSQPQASSDHWETILTEDFAKDLGKFSRGSDALYLADRFERSGVVMLKNGSENSDASIYTENISLDKPFSAFRVSVSIFGNGSMALGDKKLCLDFSVNDSDWRRNKCWTGGRDFEVKRWVDDISRVIKTADQAETFRIRIRSLGESNMDRVFVSEVRISGR